MFNLLPGQGLGFTGAQELAFGLAPLAPVEFLSGGKVVAGRWYPRRTVDSTLDNIYSMKAEEELEEILITILSVVANEIS
jgi:hypothetical protein